MGASRRDECQATDSVQSRVLFVLGSPRHRVPRSYRSTHGGGEAQQGETLLLVGYSLDRKRKCHGCADRVRLRHEDRDRAGSLSAPWYCHIEVVRLVSPLLTSVAIVTCVRDRRPICISRNAPLFEQEELLRILEAMVKRGPDGAP